MKAFLLTLCLAALPAAANDILVFLKTTTYTTTFNLEQISPPKILSAATKPTTFKSYQVIDIQANEMTIIDFYGTTSATKRYLSFLGNAPFGPDLGMSTYVVIPQKLNTTLWCGGFDDMMAMPTGLSFQYWRGTGTPLKLSTTRTISSVPRTMELLGLEASSYRSEDPITHGPGNTTGYYTGPITGSIVMQEKLTKDSSLGIPGVVKENGDPDGMVLDAGTGAYGVEMVRRLLKSQGYTVEVP